ncbi:DUF2752 domain-containing protein [Spirosoma sp. KUDC1026]|uniref:DUF2752 domain-containing protein n=1 Tax=Spirosoma sp. KUDC1026 TaxID=2745947 RepID=UPI00159BEB3E|nr:DUF2752 domain-containing protein [Spirosoma sp. KUDC1026]QKZ12487.1 DUF2752 domain-containing protein [Spirosoma sp. KUDC1026]
MLVKRLLILTGVGAALVLYYQVNPAVATFFPPCPFRLLTGLPCPGCGSQRCLHQLLHGHVDEAFALNPLLVLSLPYLLVGFVVEYSSLRTRFPQFRQRLYGRVAAWICFGLVMLYWFIRVWFFRR